MPLSTIAPTIAERIGFRRTLVTGMLLIAGGLVTFATLADPDGGYLSVLPGILILGAGVGLAMSPSTAAITASLPEEKQGVASALNDTVREMGGAVGIALIGSVLNSAYRANIELDRRPPCRPQSPNRSTRASAARSPSPARWAPTATALLNAARQAFVDGMAPALVPRGRPRPRRRRLHRAPRPQDGGRSRTSPPSNRWHQAAGRGPSFN